MIKIKNLCKSFNDKVIYDNFNLDIEDNKITVILGESGTGKTTLLNILLNQIDYQGQIEGIEKHPACVYQNDRLVKNLTVKENLALVLGENKDIIKILDSANLSNTENLYPKELSAGMSRRVAILRAFFFDSKTLLMDEPFINLDLKLKYSLIRFVKELKEKKDKTIVLVTHDIKEATLLGDRIIVLSKGHIIYDEKEVKEKTEKELFSLLINDENTK